MHYIIPDSVESIANRPLMVLCNVHKPEDKFYDVNKDLVGNINRDVRNRFQVVVLDNTGADMHTNIRHVMQEIV